MRKHFEEPRGHGLVPKRVVFIVPIEVSQKLVTR